MSLWFVQRTSGAFPYGTLAVNLGGCLLMAAILQSATFWGWSPTHRSVLAAGLVGGLTTYSSLNFETPRLLDDRNAAAAGLNVLVTLIGGYAAGWLGLLLARRLFG